MSPRGVKPNLQPDTQQRLHRQLPPPRLAGSRQTAANNAVARPRKLHEDNDKDKADYDRTPRVGECTGRDMDMALDWRGR